ncbi:MAG: hypothetical protein AAF211_33690 [Myxococcota bacterium]
MPTWLLTLTPALATPPVGHLRPVAATPSLIARFVRHQTELGRPEAFPVCRPLPVPELKLCFRVWEGDRRRWVTELDRLRWGVTAEILQSRIESNCVESVKRAVVRTVQGGTSRYLALTDGDGWAVMGLLCPKALAARLRTLSPATSFKAALPTEHVLLAWSDGNPELDRILAVGVREIHQTEPDPLTPQVLSFDGERWHPYGRAVPVAAHPTQ